MNRHKTQACNTKLLQLPFYVGKYLCCCVVAGSRALCSREASAAEQPTANDHNLGRNLKATTPTFQEREDPLIQNRPQAPIKCQIVPASSLVLKEDPCRLSMTCLFSETKEKELQSLKQQTKAPNSHFLFNKV